jgi:hypothetical protein
MQRSLRWVLVSGTVSLLAVLGVFPPPSASAQCGRDKPLSCSSTGWCCAVSEPYLCQNLRQKDPKGRVQLGWTGCVDPESPEAWKFWSQACSIWVKCGSAPRRCCAGTDCPPGLPRC